MKVLIHNHWFMIGIQWRNTSWPIITELNLSLTRISGRLLNTTILLHVLKRGVGRLCRNRNRGDDEERKAKRSKTIKCGKCGDFGHNKASCKGGATKKQKAAATNTDDASTSKCKGKSKAK